VAKRRLSYSDKQIAKAYAGLFSSPAGQIVRWDLEDRYIWRAAVTLPDFNTNQFFYNEGRRSIVLEIIEMAKRGEPDNDSTISAEPNRDPASTSSTFDPVDRSGVGDDDSSGGS
jgi:hypothetical protein